MRTSFLFLICVFVSLAAMAEDHPAKKLSKPITVGPASRDTLFELPSKKSLKSAAEASASATASHAEASAKAEVKTEVKAEASAHASAVKDAAPKRPASSKAEAAAKDAAATMEAAGLVKEEAARQDIADKIAIQLGEIRRANAARRVAAMAKAAAAKARQRTNTHTAEKSHASHGGHWGYEGDGGPTHWGEMNPAWATCASGTRQSPIDIRDGIKLELEAVKFDYRPTYFDVLDNGHTIQVGVGVGNSMTITGRRYELLQFHFHRPAEERVNGKSFQMVAHLVHKAANGRLAVIAVLIEEGQAHNLIQHIWNNLPLERNDPVNVTSAIDLYQLLPEHRQYYTYMGSLTTPPCSEGVLWIVMKQPIQLSAQQIAIFSRLYPMNARPIQAHVGRLIKESN